MSMATKLKEVLWFRVGLKPFATCTECGWAQARFSGRSAAEQAKSHTRASGHTTITERIERTQYYLPETPDAD